MTCSTFESIEIDIRGQICPSSLLLVLRAINNNHDLLTCEKCHLLVKTDNRDAIGTIPSAVKDMGFSAEVEKMQDYYRILIKG